MATLEAKLLNLKNKINQHTGVADQDLTSAVNRLIAGASNNTSSISNWILGQDYALEDIVVFNSVYYQCVALNSSLWQLEPSSSSNWQLLNEEFFLTSQW